VDAEPSPSRSLLELEARRMVEQQIRARGVSDEAVLEAMCQVPRERFVPERLRDLAYSDRALPIGEAQTISQPYMVARTLELAELEPTDHVLEVGAGSGYQAAVLSHLVASVVAIELLPELAQRAAAQLAALGLDNVEVVQGDGTAGYPPRAPYDAIVVAAGAAQVPQPLVEQLKPGGRLVIPLGDTLMQSLTVLRRGDGGVQRTAHDACVFVPLRGSGGWAG